MNLAGNLIKPEKVLLATTGDDAPVGALKGNHHDTLPAVVSLPKLGDDQSFAGTTELTDQLATTTFFNNACTLWSPRYK